MAQESRGNDADVVGESRKDCLENRKFHGLIGLETFEKKTFLRSKNILQRYKIWLQTFAKKLFLQVF